MIYLFPLIVLTIFFCRFADYQNWLCTGLHLTYITLNLLSIWYIRKHFKSIDINNKLEIVIYCFWGGLAVLFRIFVVVLFIPLVFSSIKNYFPHLEVTYRNLNENFNLNDAKAYRELEDQKEKQKPYLFYATKVNLRGRRLIFADLSHTKMVNFDFREADFRHADLTGCKLQFSYFQKTNLQGANLSDANLREAVFSEANLQGAILSEANLQKADLSEANLQGADLSWAKLQEVDLSEANLQGADLSKANLQSADLSEANLKGAKLLWANLQEADLSKANVQGAKLLWAKLQGADLSEAKLQEADLSEANLQGADLSWAKLQEVDLSEANLQGADLLGINLQEANLSGADLSNANLQEADLSKADVQGAKLLWAKLQGADLSEANLQGATLSGAGLLSTITRSTKQMTLVGSHCERSEAISALSVQLVPRSPRGLTASRGDIFYQEKSTPNIYELVLGIEPSNFPKVELSRTMAIGVKGGNLKGADLPRAIVQGALHSMAEFSLGANFYGANLQGADLSGANLQGADLSGANLQGADLSGAKLQGTDLSGANLQGADLSGANLQGADLSGAELQGAILSKANLQGTYAGEEWQRPRFISRIGKPTELQGLGEEKFSSYLFNIIKNILVSYGLRDRDSLEKWISFIKKAIGKTSSEWLEMQKGKYISGVLTWEEACKIQKEVTAPEARKRMGLDEINWEEKCR